MIVCVVYIYLSIFLIQTNSLRCSVDRRFDLTSLRIAPFVVCRVFFLFCMLFPFLFLGLKNEKDEGTGDYDRAGEGHDVWAGYQRRESKRM